MQALINDLYLKGAGSRADCKKALEICDGDLLLAEGWLKYCHCAIAIYPKENYDNWVMEKAQEWKNANNPL